MYVDVDDKVNDALVEFFTIKKEQCPEMRFVSLDDDIKRYLPNVDEVTPYAIRVFVEGVLDGTIKVSDDAACHSVDMISVGSCICSAGAK